MRESSYTSMTDIITYKTKFSYWCENCKKGPFFTAGTQTECPVCNADLLLTRNIDGDIVVIVEKKKNKRP